MNQGNVETLEPLITVVVSTYNRPDALFYALSSLVAQSMPRWVAWVIGDHCDPRTAEVVARVADERIKYINLPSRCGDQSGPNNVGASLCKTPFLAYLNHDDLLFQDHFETALNHLQNTNADFFVGRALVARNQAGSEDSKKYLFHNRPLPKGLWEAFVASGYFEPASGWLMRYEKYQLVGDWKDGLTLYRPPIADWLLRAYCLKVRFVSGTLPSVIHVNCNDVRKNPQVSKPVYQDSVDILKHVWHTINLQPPNQVRRMLEPQLSSNLQFRLKLLSAKKLWNYLIDKPNRILGTFLFRVAKIDLVVITKRWRKQQPGDWKRKMLRLRTGDTIQTPVDLEALKQYAKVQAGFDG